LEIRSPFRLIPHWTRLEVDQTDGTMKLEVHRQVVKAEKPVFDPLPEEIAKLNEEGSRWELGA
jgi:hypothetical protein